MKVSEKLFLQRDGLIENGPINVVILGDSVSHGAQNGNFDYENVYWRRLERKLHALNDFMPINMINESISGTTARDSLSRLQSRVLIHDPDLIIVCFGLNDVNNSLDDYISALRDIFAQSTNAGCDVIFMTPNMLNTYVAKDTPKQYYEYAGKTARMQNEGKMDAFMKEAVSLALSMGIAVCDCYSEWKELSKSRDTTMLLANRINHPTAEMHELFANSLYRAIMNGKEIKSREGNGSMFVDICPNDSKTKGERV